MKTHLIVLSSFLVVFLAASVATSSVDFSLSNVIVAGAHAGSTDMGRVVNGALTPHSS